MSPEQLVVEVLSWGQSLLHVALALGLVVVCIVKARSLGAGAWLIAVTGALDVGAVVIHRMGSVWLRLGAPPRDAVELYFNAISCLDILHTLVELGLFVAAFALLRAKRSG